MMKRSKDTHSRLSAIVASIVRHGRLTPEDFAECLRVRDKVTILNVIARLGYLTERHIEACTGIIDGLSEILQELCETDRLKPIPVKGFPDLYWLKPEGLAEVEKIEIPGVGTIDPANMGSTHSTTFRSCGVKEPEVMPHTLAVADVAVALYRAYSGVVLGERMLRVAEKLTGQQIGTAKVTRSRKRCPDAVVISPSGEVTAIEVEYTPHTDSEVISAARAYIRASHIARVVYIAHGKRVSQVVKRCLGAVEGGQKLVLVARNGKRLPRPEDIRPAGARRRHRRPDQSRAQVVARAGRNHGARPHNSGPNRTTRPSAERERVSS